METNPVTSNDITPVPARYRAMAMSEHGVWMNRLTDREIVGMLLGRDPAVTRWFYFVKCRPAFLSLIKKLFRHPIEYEEFVNEVVVFLMEDNARRLRSFDYRSSLVYWLQRCLVRHFLRIRQLMVDDTSNDIPESVEVVGTDFVSQSNARLDLELLLNELGKANPRYSYVIRRLLLEEAEFGEVANEIRVQVSNLYNIKKRAIRDLTAIALGIKTNRK